MSLQVVLITCKEDFSKLQTDGHTGCLSVAAEDDLVWLIGQVI